MISAARINKLATSYLNKILCRNGCETVGSAPEDPGSNPDSGKNIRHLITVNYWKDKNKEKEAGNGTLEIFFVRISRHSNWHNTLIRYNYLVKYCYVLVDVKPKEVLSSVKKIKFTNIEKRMDWGAHETGWRGPTGGEIVILEGFNGKDKKVEDAQTKDVMKAAVTYTYTEIVMLLDKGKIYVRNFQPWCHYIDWWSDPTVLHYILRKTSSMEQSLLY